MRSTRTAGITVALFLGLWSRAADAQALSEADRMTRVALIRQAREAMGAGQPERALEFAQRAEQIGPTSATRLLLAEVRASLGRHVDALSAAELCLQEVGLDTQTTAENREAIRLRCEALRDEARGRVGRVRIEVPPGSEGVEVRVGDELLRPAAWGLPRPVNAGEVVVRVSVANAPPWERRVTVSVGSEEVVRVEVPRAPRVPPPTQPPLVAPTRPQRASPWRTVGLVAGGVGVALVAGGAIAGALFVSNESDYQSRRCVAVAPNADCQSTFDSFATLNALQWTGYLAGGALVATGVVLFLTAPRSTPERTAFSCGVTLGVAGASCGGRF